ncbi:MAG: PAS domain S-box protein, partial [Gemmatimonadales bacterium]
MVPMPAFRRLIRSRLIVVVAALGVAFGVLSFAVTFWHDALGLEDHSVGLALLAGAVATILTIVGAFAVRWALRPMEDRLRIQGEESRQAYAELDAVVAASPLAIVTLDPEGRVARHWNPAAERMFGWTHAEVLGQPLPIVLPEKAAEFAELRRQALDGQPVLGRHIQRVRKDGTPIHLSLSTAVVQRGEGETPEIMAIAADISAEIEARVKLEFQGTIIDSLRDPVVAYDLKNWVTYWNGAAEELYGWTEAEMLGTYANERLQMEPVGRTLYEVKAMLDRDGQYRGEFVLHRRDGGTVHVEARCTTIRSGQGEVTGYVSVSRDLTERKEMEDHFARLSQVVEQSAELVIITEVDGSIVYVNPAFERMTGYSAAEAVGQNPRLLRSGLQDSEFYRDLWATLKRGESWAGRVRNRRKDGTLYTADAVITPVRDRNGTVVNYVGLQRDMTRESELDEQLRQAQKMEAVGQLTGGIAHDFNNLLTVILANLALLDEELREAPRPVGQSLTDIQTAARRGSEMVRKLLAFGRQERMLLQPIDLRQLVMEFIRTIGRILPEAIDLHVSTPDDLSPAQADAGAVEQILLNLATNARDAMPGGGTIELHLGRARFDDHGDTTVTGWHEPGEFLHLSVRDTGHGMNPVELERIFEPFYTTKPTGKGSGLGMAMVYGLMKQQHGFVTVDSAEGKGTSVHLYLPVTTAPAGARENRNSGQTIPRGDETLLLVEDEEPIRRVARRILEQLGYTVLTAGDGEEARTVYR